MKQIIKKRLATLERLMREEPQGASVGWERDAEVYRIALSALDGE